MSDINDEISKVVNEFGEHIYHYTSVKALFGILKNKEFWWGNTASMNDRNELLEFVGRIEDCIRTDFSIKSKERCDEFCSLLSRQVINEFPFAMCFSAREEDASQWERYADRASGVYIKMNTAAVYEIFRSCNVVFNSVYYDFDIRHHEYYKVLAEYFESGEIKGISGVDGVEGLVTNILANAPAYKNQSFWTECERRIYTMAGTEFCKSAEAYRLGFESKDNSIRMILKIRYDRLCEMAGIKIDSLFEEIVIGPRSVQNIDELKSFCKFMGFPRLAEHIRVSTCPLR